MSPPNFPGLLVERRTLEKIQESEEEFCRVVFDGFLGISKVAMLKPEFSRFLAHDAWEAYCGDVERMQNVSMPEGKEPDHFKRCGCLAYWLRRSSPVIDLGARDGVYIVTDNPMKEWRILFQKYGRAFLAFALGYHICLYYELEAGGKPPSRGPDWDYLENVCYVMKCKNISPHAMGMVYKSFFYN